jgi:hypothetical protein
MIPSTLEAEVTSTLSGHRIAMRIDSESLVHIMEIMANVYSKPIDALIREYSNNALDSHIEAGQTRPIEVTLPTPLKNELRIKDYGIGLNETDIENVYSLYGASTKRETNAQTGSLGIGAKAALCYSSKFMVIGIKDGIKTVVSVGREEDGTGVMTVVEELETDEESGVEIVIPTKSYDNFETAAMNFFRFWPVGSVLVDGEEPTALEGLPISDTMMLVEKQSNSDPSYLVMGNVPYRIPREHSPFNPDSDYFLVARIEMGAVNFTPSREDLKLTKLTMAYLTELGEQLEVSLTPAIQKDINTARSYQGAMTKAVEWRKALRSQELQKLTYKGVEIPAQFRIASTTEDEEESGYVKDIIVVKHDTRKPGQHDKQGAIQAATLTRALVVHDYHAAKFAPAHKRKLVAYAQQHDLEIEMYVLTVPPLDARWFDAKQIVSWSEIKAIKIPREQSSRNGWKVQGSYPAWEIDPTTNYASFKPDKVAAEIDTSHPIFYFDTETFGDLYRFDDHQVPALLKKAQPRCTVVKLGMNRVQKFQRDFPAATPAKEAIEAYGIKLVKKIKPRHLEAIKLQESCRHIGVIRSMDPKTIEDPELKSVIELATLKVHHHVQSLKELRNSRLILRLDIPGLRLEDVEDGYNLEKHYPLACDSGWRSKAHPHLPIYINAVYATTKEK